MTNRLQKASEQAFEAALERRVKHEFEVFRRSLPDDACDCAAPITGDFFNPQEDNAAHVKLAVQALLARRWWEQEGAPRWAMSVPLPLSNDECTELGNAGDMRLTFVAEYAGRLRAIGWDLRRALPFEAFCATVVSR